MWKYHTTLQDQSIKKQIIDSKHFCPDICYTGDMAVWLLISPPKDVIKDVYDSEACENFMMTINMVFTLPQ